MLSTNTKSLNCQKWEKQLFSTDIKNVHSSFISSAETVYSDFFFPRIILVKSNHLFKCVREEKEIYMSNDKSTFTDIFAYVGNME